MVLWPQWDGLNEYIWIACCFPKKWNVILHSGSDLPVPRSAWYNFSDHCCRIMAHLILVLQMVKQKWEHKLNWPLSSRLGWWCCRWCQISSLGHGGGVQGRCCAFQAEWQSSNMDQGWRTFPSSAPQPGYLVYRREGEKESMWSLDSRLSRTDKSDKI